MSSTQPIFTWKQLVAAVVSVQQHRNDDIAGEGVRRGRSKANIASRAGLRGIIPPQPEPVLYVNHIAGRGPKLDNEIQTYVPAFPFCFDGGIADTLAVRMCHELTAAIPFWRAAAGRGCRERMLAMP